VLEAVHDNITAQLEGLLSRWSSLPLFSQTGRQPGR
jgi:hypothetical protein